MICVLFLLLFGLTQAGVPPKTGPYEVEIQQIYVGGYVTGDSQDALVFYPKQMKRDEKYPFVVFAHGKGCGGDRLIHLYRELNSDVASWGNIVVAPLSCPVKSCGYFEVDILHTLTKIPQHPELHPIFAYADFENVGVMGHSMGGMASVQIAAMEEAVQFNLKAVSAFNPCVSYIKPTMLRSIKVPVFFITGTLDDICPNVQQAFDLDPTHTKVIANMVGKEHNDVMDFHPQSLNPYAIHFLNCQLKQQGCEYLFNPQNQDYICRNGEYTYEKCEADEPENIVASNIWHSLVFG